MPKKRTAAAGHLPQRARSVNLVGVSSPLLLTFLYLVLGMITTGALWSQMELEIEMAIDLEEDQDPAVFRVVLTALFVLVWPLVLYDIIRRSS